TYPRLRTARLIPSSSLSSASVWAPAQSAEACWERRDPPRAEARSATAAGGQEPALRESTGERGRAWRPVGGQRPPANQVACERRDGRLPVRFCRARANHCSTILLASVVCPTPRCFAHTLNVSRSLEFALEADPIHTLPDASVHETPLGILDIGSGSCSPTRFSHTRLCSGVRTTPQGVEK